MKRLWAVAMMAAVSTSLLAAEAKEEIAKAAKALAEKGNYSWKTTTEVPEGTGFRPGPVEGKADKDGTIRLTMTRNENKTEAVIKGEKAVVTDQDGNWQNVADLENSEGRGRFTAMLVRNFKAPAVQAQEIAGAVKELKKEGEAYSGDLSEEGAKNLMRFRFGGGDGPQISNAKGNAKFWVKDGVLSKYQFKVTGQMNFNGNDFDVDRTTTTEIKEVGSTKLEVPEAAKKKLT